MKVFFRVDSSIAMGSGHVMRCLTLADALKLKGGECHFICRDHPGSLIAQIMEHDYPVKSLTFKEKNDQDLNGVTDNEGLPSHSHWLGDSWQADAELTARILNEYSPDWLIVDHYSLDIRWESAVMSTCNKLMVIDDLADRKHECDVLLDQTFGRRASDYKSYAPESTKLLLGSHYALLRPEFSRWREYSLGRREKPELKQLLITFGGADPDNITSLVLDSLKNCDLPGSLEIVVVMGATAPYASMIEKQAHKMPFKTRVLNNISNMAEIMSKSDIAIGSAGSTSWERAMLGLPTITLTVADNQNLIANHLHAEGAAISMGGTEDIEKKLPESLDELMDPDKLRDMSRRASRIVDASGESRVLEEILK